MEDFNIKADVRLNFRIWEHIMDSDKKPLIINNHAAVGFYGTTDNRTLFQALNSRFGGAVVSFLTDSTRSLSGNGLERTASKPES